MNGRAGWTQALMLRFDGSMLRITSSASADAPNIEERDPVRFEDVKEGMRRVLREMYETLLRCPPAAREHTLDRFRVIMRDLDPAEMRMTAKEIAGVERIRQTTPAYPDWLKPEACTVFGNA